MAKTEIAGVRSKKNGRGEKESRRNIMKTKMLSIFILLIFDLLTGCAPANELFETAIPVTSTTQAFAPPSLSNNGETPTIKQTATIFAPSTLVSVPTFEANAAFELLRDYLKNKPPCQLPCWGGITPGNSTLGDVQKQLTVFSGISERAYFGEAGDSWITGNFRIKFDEKISIGTHYLASTSNETILFIRISTGSTESTTEGAVYAGQHHNELFFAYTLAQIVSTYGLPAQTFMTANINVAEPTSPDFFVIRLLYPDSGIFAIYTMPIETGGTHYKFCPSESLIDFDLIPQGHSNDYKNLFEQSGTLEWSLSLNSPYDKSTEEALGIENDEFYRLIISSPNQCFETPKNIWPEP
jgi:hypothetical protein